jgi:uncharacterized iron-regulated protein
MPTPSEPRILDGASLQGAAHVELDVDDLVRRGLEHDVVLVGELHDHPVGLPWAARFFDALASRGVGATPARTAALAMEFFERDEQDEVDALVRGELGEAAFLEATGLRRGPWELGHRAMVETARRHGLPVVAANAPRAYTKRARIEGLDALRALPEAERALFALPDPLPGGRYRERFAELMGGHEAMGEEKLAGFFVAQSVWDATMSESVLRTLDAGRAPVVLVVGRFHVEHDGGVVQLLRRARPELRAMVVAMIEGPEEIEPGRGDVLVEVGPAPKREH